MSIIIAARNAQNHIAAALQSAAAQSWPHKEIIVVDGASVDGTLDAIQNSGVVPQVLISEPDAGVYDALNKGINKSHGEWIYILGADDRLADENVLEKIFSTHIPPNLKLIYGHVLNEEKTHPLVPSIHQSRFGSALVWRNTLHQQSAFYHRTVFDTFRFNTAYRTLADYDLHLLLLHQHIDSRYVDATIAVCHAQGLSKQFGSALYREELRLKRQHLPALLWLLNVPWVWFKYLSKQVA